MWLFAAILPWIVPAHADEIDATLRWSQRVELSTPVSGVVVEVAAQPGQRVAKDQTLLRLDTAARRANVDQAKAQVARRSRLRDEAQRELDRAQELYNATLLAEHELELARIGVDDAEAEFQQARALQAQAESDLKYSEVRAPFDALVVQRNAEPGQTVVSQLQAAPLFVVAQADVMVAAATVSLARARALKPEQPVKVVVGGRNYDGKVMHVALEPTPRRDGYELAVMFETHNVALRAGESARIILP